MKTLFLSIIISVTYFLLSVPYGDYVTKETEKVIAVEPVRLEYNAPTLEPLFSEEEVMCLQENIFFEAAVEDFDGRIAVALVTLNRVSSNKFPDTICGVVKQARVNAHGVPYKHQCQFSWYCDGLSDRPDFSNKYVTDVWNEIGELADYIANDPHGHELVGDSLFYHVNGHDVSWSDDYTVHAVIGSHVFYVMN